jgi:hypothetical protein
MVASGIIPESMREVAEFEIDLRLSDIVKNKMTHFAFRVRRAAELGQGIGELQAKMKEDKDRRGNTN